MTRQPRPPAAVLLLFVASTIAVGSPRPPRAAGPSPVPTVERVEPAPGLAAVVYPDSAVVWITGPEKEASTP